MLSSGQSHAVPHPVLCINADRIIAIIDKSLAAASLSLSLVHLLM